MAINLVLGLMILRWRNQRKDVVASEAVRGLS